MNRRELLKLGTMWASSLSGTACLTAPREETLEPVQDLAVRLHESLEGAGRAKVLVPYDHPLRQYHNRGVHLGGADIDGSHFSWEQRKLLNRLFYAGLSREGRDIVPHQQFIRWMGLRTLKVLIAGDPKTPEFQVIFSGPHMNLRLGGRNREGVAFGGPQIYGDQRGNNRQGLPGNVYRYQFQQADDLFGGLSSAERQKALAARAPIQTQIELRGERGSFEGVPVGELSRANRAKAKALVRDILKVYHPEAVAYAWQCLDANGGVETLHLSYYQEGEVRESGQYQIFRLEGPAAVFYFRGFPHVHAFINVAMDGNRPLSVGEIVGENGSVLEGEGVKDLFENVMRAATGTDFAYYDLESAVGRLRTGTIRTGDIYNLESWIHTIHVVSLEGVELSGYAESDLVAQGVRAKSSETYRIATTDYLAGEERRRAFGRARSRSTDVLLRDAAIEYLRRNGFPRSGRPRTG